MTEDEASSQNLWRLQTLATNNADTVSWGRDTSRTGTKALSGINLLESLIDCWEKKGATRNPKIIPVPE